MAVSHGQVLVVGQSTTGEVVLGGRVRTQSALTGVGVNLEVVGGSQDGVILGHHFLELGPVDAQTVVVIRYLVTAVALDTGLDITTEAGLAEAGVHFGIITTEAGLAEAGVSLDITTEAGLAEASLDLSIITAEAGLAEGDSGSDIITTEAGLAEAGLDLSIITAEAGLAEAGSSLDIITTEAGLAEAGLHFSIITAEAGFAEAGSGFDITTEAGLAETSLHLGIITAEAGLAEAGSSLNIVTTEAGLAEFGLDFDITAKAGLAELSGSLDIITTEASLAEGRLGGRLNCIPLVVVWSGYPGLAVLVGKDVLLKSRRAFTSGTVHRPVLAELVQLGGAGGFRAAVTILTPFGVFPPAVDQHSAVTPAWAPVVALVVFTCDGPVGWVTTGLGVAWDGHVVSDTPDTVLDGGFTPHHGSLGVFPREGSGSSHESRSKNSLHFIF